MVGTGIGPALRKARLVRGKSIEEASRETRIRAEYLQALERERFEALLGDVYVRGFLRSYSTYLGLDPSKVLTIYTRHFGEPRATLPDPTPGPVRTGGADGTDIGGGGRHHPSWRFLIGVAVLLLAVFAAVGLLARPDRPTAGTEAIPTGPPAAQGADQTVTVGIKALEQVTVSVRVDGGEALRFLLHEEELRSFEGTRSVAVVLQQGGAAELTVNDHELGVPGVESSRYSATFGPTSYREQKESPPSATKGP